MFDEWERSAHARSASSPLYVAAAAAAKQPECAHCHTPLVAEAPTDPVSTEGVTCDVCHTLRDPKPAASGAGFHLAIDDMVKFGPRCDLKDHYFHRMGCSPEHKEAAICGSCHWWEPKGLPVFTEYPDWRDGPAAKEDLPCQGCHMSKSKAALAVGAPVRDGVPDHGLLGIAGDLRLRALSLDVAVKDTAGELSATVTLTNVGAGHPIPAGLPERRIVVTARIRDEAGQEVAIDRRVFGRVLVDASGTEVPFWRASKVGEDTRILPGGTRTMTFTFQPAGAGTLEIEVEHRAASEAMAKALGQTEIDHHAMTSAKVPFGAPRAGGRAKLPKTVTVKPPRAGTKRPAKQGSP